MATTDSKLIRVIKDASWLNDDAASVDKPQESVRENSVIADLFMIASMDSVALPSVVEEAVPP